MLSGVYTYILFSVYSVFVVVLPFLMRYYLILQLSFVSLFYGKLYSLVVMVLSLTLLQVTETDRGVLLTREEHKEVGEIAEELQKYCVDAPVKCPLIFGGKYI